MFKLNKSQSKYICIHKVIVCIGALSQTIFCAPTITVVVEPGELKSLAQLAKTWPCGQSREKLPVLLMGIKKGNIKDFYTIKAVCRDFPAALGPNLTVMREITVAKIMSEFIGVVDYLPFKGEAHQSFPFVLTILPVASNLKAMGFDDLKACLVNGQEFDDMVDPREAFRTIVAIVANDPKTKIDAINQLEKAPCYSENIFGSLLSYNFVILQKTMQQTMHFAWFLFRCIDSLNLKENEQRDIFIRRIKAFLAIEPLASRTEEEKLTLLIFVSYCPIFCVKKIGSGAVTSNFDIYNPGGESLEKLESLVKADPRIQFINTQS